MSSCLSSVMALAETELARENILLLGTDRRGGSDDGTSEGGEQASRLSLTR